MALPRSKQDRPRTGWAESPHLDREPSGSNRTAAPFSSGCPENGQPSSWIDPEARLAAGGGEGPLLGAVGGELAQQRLVDAAQIVHRLGRPVAPQGFQCREAVGLGRHEVRCRPAFCQEQVAEPAQRGQVADGRRSWGGGGAQEVGARGIIAALRGGAGG